jgi:hypothetical protein
LRHKASVQEVAIVSSTQWRCAVAAAVLLVCPGAAVTPVAQEPIDDQYKALEWDGRKAADPGQVDFFVKAIELAGKLRLCVGYVAEMSDTRFDVLMRSLRHPSSFVRVGEPEGSPFRIRPFFAIGTRSLPVGQAPLHDHLPHERMRASCIDTEADWRDDFATSRPAMGLYANGHVELTIRGFGRKF